MMKLSHTSALLLLSIVAAGCSETTNSTGTISKRIGEIVHSPGARELDLRTLPTFGWDNLYVFKASATRDEMCSFLSASRNVCGRVVRVDKTPDGHMAMVFSLGGQVTHFEFHAIGNGQFDYNFTQAGLPKERAVFRIRRVASSGDAQQIWLEPQ